MNRAGILLTFIAAGALATGSALAQPNGASRATASAGSRSDGQKSVAQPHDMECSHYMAMNGGAKMAAVNSMRSKMPGANAMASSHEMAMKVDAGCRDHPKMMVHKVMEDVMPRTSVTPH